MINVRCLFCSFICWSLCVLLHKIWRKISHASFVLDYLMLWLMKGWLHLLILILFEGINLIEGDFDDVNSLEKAFVINDKPIHTIFNVQNFFKVGKDTEIRQATNVSMYFPLSFSQLYEIIEWSYDSEWQLYFWNSDNCCQSWCETVHLFKHWIMWDNKWASFRSILIFLSNDTHL